MLRPIAFQSLDEALPVLTRGFPAVPSTVWRDSFDRLRRHGAADPAARVGYLLQAGDRDVGVILTIPSERTTEAQNPLPVVNVSSWYIDPDHRWRAPRMLQQVVACNETLYLDLTPTEPVRKMIGRFGFRRWTEGALLFVLPWFAVRPARGSHVVPLHKLPADCFAPAIGRMMEEHAALGCIAAGLWDGRTLHPLIFSRTKRRGAPVARLIYADDRSAVFAHMAAIARFLLHERVPILAVNANRDERVSGSIFTQRPAPAFFKGATEPAPSDLTYSEYVFLKI